MSTYAVDVATLARKDVLLELRSRDTLPAMLLFVVSALVVFHFALPADASDRAEIGLFWIALIFTALLGLTRAFAAEREQSLLDGLVLAPVDRSAIWAAKVISVVVFLALAEAVARRPSRSSSSRWAGSSSRPSLWPTSGSPPSAHCSPPWPQPAARGSCSSRCSSCRSRFPL